MQLSISNLSSLPFPDIVRALETRYTHAETKALSSHWKVYAKSSQATIQSSGKIVKITGVGFGDYSTRPHDLVFGCLNYATYLPALNLPWPLLKQHIKNLANLKVSRLSYDAFRQAAIATCLLSHEKSILRHPPKNPRICIIGDGWGLLAALLKQSLPSARITIVDLGKTLMFSSLFLQDRFPKACFNLAEPDQSVKADADFTFVPAEEIKQMHFSPESFDFAINVASMQEMDHAWIAFYFDWLRSTLATDGQFYCCNRVHKTLPDGTETNFTEYPWKETDTVLIDEEPSFYRWFFSTQKTIRNVRFCGIKVPFLRLFDGPFRHRLVRLARI